MQSIQCATCANRYHKLDRLKADRQGIMPNGCRAFPAGIPPEVRSGQVDHRKPYGEDSGVMWEQAEGASFPYSDEEVDEDISSFSLVCGYCEHLTSTEERQCEAFPKGIPLVIWNGDNDHTSAYANDGGIQFERREE